MIKKCRPIFAIGYIICLLAAIGTFVYHSFRFYVIYDKISLVLSIIGAIISAIVTLSIRISNYRKANDNIIVTCIFLAIIIMVLLGRIIWFHTSECQICLCSGSICLILLAIPAIILFIKR